MNNDKNYINETRFLLKNVIIFKTTIISAHISAQLKVFEIRLLNAVELNKLNQGFREIYCASNCAGRQTLKL